MHIYDLLYGISYQLFVFPFLQVGDHSLQATFLIGYLPEYMHQSTSYPARFVPLQFAEQGQDVLRVFAPPQFYTMAYLAAYLFILMMQIFFCN